MVKSILKKKPLVSIIINCYNGEKYLDECIKSVLYQSYQNWEIIFFDNNSNDKSSLMLRKYKDKRIKYFKSKKTFRLYQARNLAIKKCNGELVSFLDVDDWWSKDKLTKQKGVDIGPFHKHGGISNGAIGFDAFFPKRNEKKYKREVKVIKF